MHVIEALRPLLQRVAYPADRAEILHTLRALDAPPELLDRVATLPDARYGSADTVLDLLRGRH
jgi:hypothetical protein